MNNQDNNDESTPSGKSEDTNYLTKQIEEKKSTKKENDRLRLQKKRALQTDKQKQSELDANAKRNAETRFNLLSCNTAVYLLGSSEQAKAICYYKFDYLNS